MPRRALEEVVIRTLGEIGIEATREPGLTGVWVNGAKVCAIGVKLSRWVSMHGLALNVFPDLDHFESIVPCGIADKPVTSIARLLSMEEDDPRVLATLSEQLHRLMLRHFAAVFAVQLEMEEDVEVSVRGALAEKAAAERARVKMSLRDGTRGVRLNVAATYDREDEKWRGP